ncbi:MAG: hypothetical protein ACOCV8_04180, partial [Spirochaetota bacterium]
MAEPTKNNYKTPKLLNKIKEVFQKDFFKWTLFTIWLITIIFTLFINFFIFGDAPYEGTTNEFAVFDSTKTYLELALSISIIAAMILIFIKRKLAEKIGIVISIIVLFLSLYVIIFYSISNATYSENNVFNYKQGWNMFKHILFLLIHSGALLVIILDKKNISPPKMKSKD